ncbi:MAG: non-hydrolyzing UDP-N-acetylglucosamine 2-epimerase [Thermoanaerobaculaceae bacterium]
MTPDPSPHPLIATVVGARPQFIKAAPVSSALRSAGLDERLIHTGQHYDAAMSGVFFQTLGLPEPAVHLGIGSNTHGAQSGRMLEAIERVLLDWSPDLVLVYGDTNSTLAGALAAAKLHIQVAHVEAGLRSFNQRMPEEINRVLTDHVSRFLFAPTDAAVANLAREGPTRGVVRTGDVMLDAVLRFRSAFAPTSADVVARHGLTPGRYALVTIHRAENTDDPARWNGILEGVRRVGANGLAILWPVHPRVGEAALAVGAEGIRLSPPLSYFDTQSLLMHAKVVITDSGGLQKEAAFHGVPCVTVRDETEWVELVEAGVNVLAGADPKKIVQTAQQAAWPPAGLPSNLYGDGDTADCIAQYLRAFF